MRYELTKPIRLIELFAGVGAQAKALKNIGVNFEHYLICEWEINANASYKAIHMPDDNYDYSQNLTKEELVDYLFKKGISSDGDKPMRLDTLKRKNEKWLRRVYNNIKATNNLVNIQQVKGVDLNIVETDKYTYVLTYSFPCQDISIAGKGAGMSKDGSTRSGMLWEVERLLKEIKELPQILLMENVPQVHNKKHIKEFNKWIAFLESLGYSNFWEDLNAKDYGIPQNRNRTYMVSILGNHHYVFPKKQKLELSLKDMLEDEVDEKYYLSDKMIACFTDTKDRNGFIRGKVFRPHTLDSKYAYTITTKAGSRPSDNFIILPVVKGGAIRNRPNENGVNQPNLELRKDDVSNALTTFDKDNVVVVGEHRRDEGIRIRKLTPKECWRLMGFDDEDFDRVSKEMSNSQLYKQAGNSIVVPVLEAIFRELLL